jgi:hypothetical protein
MAMIGWSRLDGKVIPKTPSLEDSAGHLVDVVQKKSNPYSPGAVLSKMRQRHRGC